MSAAMSLSDDLGCPCSPVGPVRRVVSLVPSLTEAVASVDRSAIIGATDWCTHPADLETTRIRGTKNPDVRAIIALAPDLVIANQEENREIDVRRLRDAGVAVWVTRIESLAEAFDSLERLFEIALGWGTPAWLDQARERWAAPPADPTVRVIVPIWRDPWMVVGPRTFTADLLRRAGGMVVPDDAGDRYPSLPIDALDQLGADVVLLPDEPYVFTAADGPEAFVRTPTRLANGRLLTWYGPSLVEARAHIEGLLSRT
jgi:ABC-type Fe3+-hydroxamate transport system substrate-binding protein